MIEVAYQLRDHVHVLVGSEELEPGWPHAAILGDLTKNPMMTPARGISIYFPLFLDRSVFYRELDFGSATHWADLLDACVGNARTPEAR